jgi:hypothetical protein
METGSEFKNLVNKHAASYVSKKINTYLKNNRVGYDDFLKVSVDYILEECAAVVQLFKCGADLLTYPGGMNPPARYVWNHYFKNESLRYVRYEVKTPVIKPVSTLTAQSSLFTPKKEDPPSSCASSYVHWALKRENWSLSQQYQFIRGVERLIPLVNFNYSQNEIISETTKITRRSSV